jgi:hypothetical protein
MPGLELTILEDDRPEGARILVSCLSVQHIEAHGLRGPAVVGWLTRPLKDDEAQIPPDIFLQNEAFLRFLHGLIARRGLAFPALLDGAEEHHGWLCIVDRRVRKRGAAPTRSDLLGGFQLRDGKPVAGSYQPNSEYAVLTQVGFMRLPDEFQDVLLQELVALHLDQQPSPDAKA